MRVFSTTEFLTEEVLPISSLRKPHKFILARGCGPNTSTFSDAEITALLTRLDEAQYQRDLTDMSRIADQLLEGGVFVTNRTYRHDGVHHDFSLHPDTTRQKDASPLIHKLLADLLRAEQNFNKQGVQLLKKHLLANYKVLVDLKNRTWRADGIHHGYALAADAGPNVSSLSDHEIQDLMASRQALKEKKDFRKADMIREQLKRARVMVDDQQLRWRADGVMHDYERMPGTIVSSLLSEREINNLLHKRSDAKQRRNYGADNAVVQKLKEYGVYVNEATKRWRADGRIPFAQEKKDKFEPIEQGYQPFSDAGPIRSTLDEGQILKLLSQVQQARAKKDYTVAKMLRTRLISAGVMIDDRKMKWRADGVKHLYERDPRAGPIISRLRDRDIHELLAYRMKAKRLKHYDVDNNLALELREAGVVIDEDKRMWRADGQQMHNYILANDCGPLVSDLTSVQIHKLIEQHAQAYLDNDVVNVKRHRVSLRKAGVFVDGRRKRYRWDGYFHEYILAEDAGTNVSALSYTAIHTLLTDRQKAKRKKQYDIYNDISAELNANGVWLNELKRTWAADGRRHDFERVQGSGPNASQLSIEMMHALLSKIKDAQTSSSMEKPSSAEAALFQANVFVDTASLCYRNDGIMHNYTCNSVANNSGLSVDEINDRIAMYLQAKSANNYDKAIKTRGELIEAGVVLDDSSRTWRTLKTDASLDAIDAESA
jgi:cysteinyl-tRNA synthetase